MNRIQRVHRFVFLALASLLPSIAAGGPSLTIVAPAAPGGGWDQTARVMQRVLAEIEPGTSVQVENVPGAAGTIGLARFIQSERGNPDALLVTGLVMVSGAVINRSPVTLADVMPIARLTGEFEVIVVPTASPHRSLEDLLAAFRRHPGQVSWGGGSAGGTDDLLIRLVAEQLGMPAASVNYLAFAGGGAALGAVLGGQVAAGVSGYSEFAGQVEAGELRVLAVSAPQRVAGINAPTLREAGVALDLANWRAVVAPPGLSDTERLALTDRVTRLAQSEPWKAAIAQNGWIDLFLPGLDFRQFLLAEQARVEMVMQRLAGSDRSSAVPLTLSLTPATLPMVFVTLLAGSVAAFAVRSRRSLRFDLRAARSAMLVVSALLLLPLLFTRVGFVAASTLLFAVVAHALDAPSSWTPSRRLALNVALGLLFSAALFVIFSRGLGVLLPPTPGLRGLL